MNIQKLYKHFLLIGCDFDNVSTMHGRTITRANVKKFFFVSIFRCVDNSLLYNNEQNNGMP